MVLHTRDDIFLKTRKENLAGKLLKDNRQRSYCKKIGIVVKLAIITTSLQKSKKY
ncbi:hypothetical protein HanRHA438_Chr05g0231861 [Helianthus annuus]|uniref:Uncharacterized protein n=1 Tax=Helianthus annuus TaxID=4232 RepID=A0A9K3J1E2_HELAN|nr:hypothetical protein HanXRQr2_Chr05g0222791 [Helianthus annuus]KAJ0570809.1 hypothetical protein HanHA300_Chr05g0182351 [Helianthus annuus]KAJ0577766.1 hypothetical protein HanIR_Chr05g0239741 [Helianthus annuus]KAJ0585149.1 hypothetical protein HanHA89_Chr05g0197001 [Helianthus annuus]KAJ0747695.1 hypothetical protein HanOQP8_Chr05g0192531 [Helianthus annuus]